MTHAVIQLRDAVKAAINAEVSPAYNTVINRRSFPFTDDELPAIEIAVGETETERGAMSSYHHAVDINISIYAKDKDDPDGALYAASVDVHSAISSATFPEFVVDATLISSSEPLDPEEIETPASMMTITWRFVLQTSYDLVNP